MDGVVLVLSSSGKLINKREIKPSLIGQFWGSRMLSCMRWGKGFAVIGETNKFTPSADGIQSNGSNTSYYWALHVKEDGSTDWERLFDRGVFSSYFRARALPNGDLLIVNSDHSDLTELVQITADGNLRQHSTIPKFYHLIDSDAADSNIQLYGTNGSAGWITLSSDLRPPYQVVSAVTASNESIPVEGDGHLLHDGSLVIFGGMNIPGPKILGGGGWRARVARLEPKTGDISHIDLEPFDVGVDAFLPTGNPDEFITARSISSGGELSKSVQGAAIGPFTGIVITFIKF